MKLEEAQRKLEVQCGREPTVGEWAEAVGMSCRELQSSIRIGRRCREKMARSNFRLVIHVARKYEGYGLDIQDLIQVWLFYIRKNSSDWRLWHHACFLL